KRTLGVPLFQEQLLRMAMVIAGLSGGEAEELRRAMGFKRADKRLAKIETRLRSGMSDKGLDQETQDQIVANIMAFANYGFPESHAASFALLTYASAYLKVHYLAEFTTAMLNNYPLGFYAPATLIKDAQRHGLHFRHVDVNYSDYLFTVENGYVRVGLKFVKGLRKEVAEMIMAERDGCGSLHISKGENALRDTLPNGRVSACFYASIDDLVKRVPMINKKEIRALSLAGALNFERSVHRREALWQSELAIRPIEPLLNNAECGMRNAESNPKSKIQSPKSELGTFIKKMGPLQLVETDLSTTGISIGRHPMSFLREELNKRGILSAAQTYNLKKRDIVTVAGAVIVRQRPSTAKDVVFITMEDETGHSNFIILPDVFEKFRQVITHNDYLLIKGIVEEANMIKGLYFESIGGFMANVKSHDFH
ncbi:MAG TPA: hypothetical protein VLI65_07510, partial [Pyrinomonadaceae bacterium]|nr:hypothetical protein [Pyrinomonadaceae bacterium]